MTCAECGQITGPTWDGVCRACYEERYGIDPTGHHDRCGCSPCVPPDDAPSPDDAGLLASWSGHDWYRDLGGEGGHE